MFTHIRVKMYDGKRLICGFHGILIRTDWLGIILQNDDEIDISQCEWRKDLGWYEFVRPYGSRGVHQYLRRRRMGV